MNNPSDCKTKQNPIEEEATIMNRNDITKVTVDYFHHGPYRYTDLRDAVAQSRRAQAEFGRNDKSKQ